jgi:hypothetical protein
MCHICYDWENNQLSSDKAFQLIGQSLKVVENEEDRDHLMELCDKIVDSLDRYAKLHT